MNQENDLDFLKKLITPEKLAKIIEDLNYSEEDRKIIDRTEYVRFIRPMRIGDKWPLCSLNGLRQQVEWFVDPVGMIYWIRIVDGEVDIGMLPINTQKSDRNRGFF